MDGDTVFDANEREFLVTDRLTCYAMTPSAPFERVYADSNHLTVAGSAFLGRQLAKAGLPVALKPYLRP